MSVNLRDKLYLLREKGLDNGRETYEISRVIADAVLQDYYCGIKKQIRFPIDIWGIVRSYGIEIIQTELNSDIGFRIARQNGSLRYLQDGRIQIYLEDSDSDNAKRYILAHEFSHFLLNKGEKKVAMCYSDPMMPKRGEEQIADIMASCLLFPYDLVLEKMLSYINQMRNNNRYPINSADWLQELAETAHVSSYHTIICYQNVKNCICYLYNRNDKIARDVKFSELFK